MRVVDVYSGKEITGVAEADDDAGWFRRFVPGPVGKLDEETVYRKIRIERRNEEGQWVKA
jgi:hypothetical protein